MNIYSIWWTLFTLMNNDSIYSAFQSDITRPCQPCVVYWILSYPPPPCMVSFTCVFTNGLLCVIHLFMNSPICHVLWLSGCHPVCPNAWPSVFFLFFSSFFIHLIIVVLFTFIISCDTWYHLWTSFRSFFTACTFISCSSSLFITYILGQVPFTQEWR